jgi:hypothetical protein
MKRARHAIYLKIHRLVKSGVLVVASKSGKSTHYAQAVNADLKLTHFGLKTPIQF